MPCWVTPSAQIDDVVTKEAEQNSPNRVRECLTRKSSLVVKQKGTYKQRWSQDCMGRQRGGAGGSPATGGGRDSKDDTIRKQRLLAVR